MKCAKRLIIVIIFGLILIHGVHAQLSVNEMMSSNTVTMADNYGAFSDWVELYNNASVPIDLAGYSLSTVASNLTYWTFPSITLDPGHFMIVWCSSRNLINTSAPLHTNFKIKKGGEPIFLTAPDNITIISQIPSTPLLDDQSIGHAIDGTGPVVILATPTPGYSNIINITTPPSNTTNTTNTTTNTTNTTAYSLSNISINEMMSSNVNTILDEDGDPSDWIELYNNGTTSINLSGYYLTDNTGNLTEWKFPERIISPKEYLIVWASNKDRGNATAPLHTNFAIKAGGEPIVFTAPDGTTIINQIPPFALTADQSYGRLPDSSANLEILPAPSPGENNNVVPAPSAPLFSKGAGFYNASFKLTITDLPNTTIYYTLDGSTPTASSFIYTGPINISNATGNPNNVSMINTTSPTWEAPNGLVRKGTVVRAIAVRNNQSSRITTGTYFLDGNFTMPVISISTDSNNLFDYNTGIYTMGASWDNASGWPNGNVFHPANYENDGDAWERPVHLEIFWNNGSRVINQDAGLRITGQGSRVRPQKSMKLYARAEYGASTILFPLFPQQNFTDYKRLSIRNGDGDLRATYLRDVLAHKLAEGSPLAMEPYYPSAVFINGEYWGFYPMRERDSQFFLASRYGVNKDDVIILTDNAVVDQGNPGDEQSYLDMQEFIRTHDMSNQANYDYIQTQMDTTDFARYYAVNTFVANTDWIDRNLVYWRLRGNGTNTSAPFGWDGKWRWIMHDDDWTFGYEPGTSASTNMFNFIDTKTWGAVMWDKLSKNEQFRNSYVTISADNLNTNFSTNNVISNLDQLASGVAPEIQREIDRWGDIPDVATWQKNLENIRQFARDRPAYHEQYIAAFFGLAGTENLTVDKTGDGKITINSITPSAYPWTGMEFADIPVTLNATPGIGSVFVGWEGAASGTNPQINIVFSQATSVRAVFAPIGNNITAQGSPIWITRKYPATYNIISNNQTKTFLVEISNPASAPVQESWLLDGVPIKNDSLDYTLNASNISVGVHSLQIQITSNANNNTGNNTTIIETWSISVHESMQSICYNAVQQLPVNCTGGAIASDALVGGCRSIVCSSGSNSVSVMACNKPSDTNPTYYEVYRTSFSGQPPQICLGQTCIQNNGYTHANLPVCIATSSVDNSTNSSGIPLSISIISTPPGTLSINSIPIGLTPQNFEIPAGNWNVSITAPGFIAYNNTFSWSTNVSLNITLAPINGSGSQTCYASLQNIPANCTGGAIVQDSYNGCRSIVCTNASSAMQVLACDKPTTLNPTNFEMYKQSQNGTGVSQICIGNTCISNNGFAISSNYPLCFGSLTNSTGNTTNSTGNTTGNSTYILSIFSTPIGNLFINGTGYGVTPQSVNLSTGTYFVNVSVDGYISNTTTILLSGNITLNLSLAQASNQSNGTNQTNNQTNITLSGCDIIETLHEGQTKTYAYNNKVNATVGLVIVQNTTAVKFSVDTQLTPFMSPGNSFTSNTSVKLRLGNVYVGSLDSTADVCINLTTIIQTNTTCYNILASIPATCTGGGITQDVVSGACRALICSDGSNSLGVLACEKPDIGVKQYFEMYKQTSAGIAPKICIGQACIQNNGYAQSALYPICLATNNTGNNTINDTTPPIISNGLPSGILPSGTTSATLQATTNEPATCRYDVQNSTPYASMATFANTGNVLHTQSLTGLHAGSYNYFVLCKDAANNTNTAPYAIIFSIANATNTTNTTANTTVQLQVAPWYPKGLAVVWICNTSGGSGSFIYDFRFGDGQGNYGIAANNVYYTYPASGAYNASCTVHDLVLLNQTSGSTSITI